MNSAAVLALTKFAQCQIDLSELQDALAGVVRLLYADTDERTVEYLSEVDATIHFGRSDIERVLRSFLQGAVTARQTSDWAATLRLLEWYDIDPADTSPDEVWEVIDELMSPDAWGSLTTESALTLIQRL